MRRLRLPFLAALAAIGLAGPAAAAAPAAPPPEDRGGPLVYAFVIDGLDGDRVDAGRAPYLSALLAGADGTRATYFRESRSVMIAETNSNHVAMATGAYPDRNGIPGNSFGVYAPIANGDSCPTGPTDESRPPSVTTGVDPRCLEAETMFGAVERQRDPEDVVTAGIFGKPKLASFFSGRTADGSRHQADHLWTPCMQPTDPRFCTPVPRSTFESSAVFDRTVMDEVLRTVREGVAGDGRTFTGTGQRPNLTFVNLPGVDLAGHRTGAGPAYDAAIASADGQIERFVEQQRALGLWDRTVMLVLSDHSMDSTPTKSALGERLTAAGIPGDAYTLVQNGSAALLYVNDRTSPGRFALLARIRAAALAGSPESDAQFGPPAHEALYREPNPADGGIAHTVDAVHPAWHLGGPRSGDLVLTVGPTFAFAGGPAGPFAGSHGGPQTRDNFLAVVGGCRGVLDRTISGVQRPGYDDTEQNPTSSENVDVAPTLLHLLGRRAPAESEGRFLREAFHPSLRSAPGAERPRERACGG